MKTLNFNNEEYMAEKIIKTNTNIIGKNGNSVVFSFKGIKDFTQFKLEEGQEFDISEEDEKMLYDLDIDFRLSKIEMGL